MSIKELRIGNILSVSEIVMSKLGILYNSFKVVAIDRDGLIHFQCLHDNTIHICVYADQIVPCEISDEWLIKLGLKLDENVYRRDNFSIIKTENGYSLCGVLLYGIFPKPIKHVHQIQNLFLDLTGNEL